MASLKAIAPILIASALLLSGACNGSAQSGAPPGTPTQSIAPTPVPVNTKGNVENASPNQQQSQHEAQASSHPSASEHLIGPLASEPNTGEYGYEDENGQVDKWIAIFTCFLVLVTAIQARLLYKQLHSDRPFLVAEAFDLIDFSPIASNNRRPLVASVEFRNYGKGPAFITKVRTTVTIVKKLPLWRYYGLCEPWDIRGEVIGPNQATERVNALLMRSDGVPPKEQPPVLSQEEFTDIMQGNRKLVFYGTVEYRDAFKKRHKTGFFWICDPPRANTMRTQARFVRGPNSRNYYR